MSRRVLRALPLAAALLAAAAAHFPFVAISPAAAQPAAKARPLALVVGINNYDDFGLDSLNYAVRDATALNDELKRAGFEVKLLKNDAATKKGIESALADLLEKRQPGQLLLVALSGHGLQSTGADGKEDAFFCPKDTDKGRGKNLLSLSALIADMGSRGTNLLVVDACRNDPKRGARNFVGNELTNKLPARTAVLFSCTAGQVSIETNRMFGEKSADGHGVFFYHVLEGLRGKAKNPEGNVTWNGLAEYVMQNVNKRAKEWEPDQARVRAAALDVPLADLRFQTPHQLNNLDESVVLVAPRDLGSPAPVPKKDLGSLPVEVQVEFNCVIDGETRKGTCRVLTLDIGGGEKMEFVRISKGKFTMGSPKEKEEKERGDDEDEHEVEITKDFYLGRYAVTQAQYKAIVGENPSSFKGDRLPVETVSWDDAVKFCEKFSTKLNRKTMLPSEAQWEYACRAGTRSPFHFGTKLNGDLANCDGNYPYGTETKGDYKKKTVEVGSYPANPWGLYDMSGNVYQWCQDWYGPYQKLDSTRDPVQLIKQSDNYKTLRGGSWNNDARNCRSALRNWGGPDNRGIGIFGFRVCLPLEK